MSGFPFPGDPFPDGVTVIASCPYIDDERGELALVLLLETKPPYFTVAHYAVTDFDPKANDVQPDGIAYQEGEIDVLGHFHNIVPAVQEYENSGGDY